MALVFGDNHGVSSRVLRTTVAAPAHRRRLVDARVRRELAGDCLNRVLLYGCCLGQALFNTAVHNSVVSSAVFPAFLL